jgi:ABC-type uncharacterized transport system ATPase subunit
MNTPAVELQGLAKRFGSCIANSDISLRAEKGTIHAIVGENGAGKSTAMKMLYGLYPPDSGEILVDGKPWGGRKRWKSPSDAIACGIGMVHQHFMLADPYSALENVVLGAESAHGAWSRLPRPFRPVDFAGARAKLERLSSAYGFAVDWDAPIERLPVGVQQRIEILKLLYREASVLILDEPTAVLTPQETVELFANLRKLAAEGKTILIITHKLKEVMAIADRVTVFRAGKVVGDVLKSETSPAGLANMMVGRKVALTVESPPAPALGKPVLELKGVSLSPKLLSDVSFEIRAGEIVGIAGIEGNGQSDLLQILQHPATYGTDLSGEIRVLGSSVNRLSASEIKRLGVGVVPEDRHREGLLLESTLRDNFLLGLQRSPRFSTPGLCGFIREKELASATERVIREYDVRPADANAIAGRLSGGNQQKLIIGREFDRAPGLFIAAQPTRGVDVGAIEFIHKRIFRARDEGAGVLVVSSELDEILSLSDRILVMYAGRIVAQFARGQASEQALGLHMGGVA